MAFDNYPPGVKPSDVGSENEPGECEYCGDEVYETGADTRMLSPSELFCDDDCIQMFIEEEWGQAIEDDEQLPQRIEEYIKTEMIE